MTRSLQFSLITMDTWLHVFWVYMSWHGRRSKYGTKSLSAHDPEDNDEHANLVCKIGIGE